MGTRPCIFHLSFQTAPGLTCSPCNHSPRRCDSLFPAATPTGLASGLKPTLRSPHLLTATIVVTLLLGIAVLTGRRKAVVEVAVFASTYFILWITFKKSSAKFGILLAIVGLVGFGWLVAQLGSDPLEVAERPSGYALYVERSKSAFGDVPDRFVQLERALPVTYVLPKPRHHKRRPGKKRDKDRRERCYASD